VAVVVCLCMLEPNASHIRRHLEVGDDMCDRRWRDAAWAQGMYARADMRLLFAGTWRWERPQLNTVHHLTAEHALHLPADPPRPPSGNRSRSERHGTPGENALLLACERAGQPCSELYRTPTASVPQPNAGHLPDTYSPRAPTVAVARLSRHRASAGPREGLAASVRLA
jgi:hypothetical protein